MSTESEDQLVKLLKKPTFAEIQETYYTEVAKRTYELGITEWARVFFEKYGWTLDEYIETLRQTVLNR